MSDLYQTLTADLKAAQAQASVLHRAAQNAKQSHLETAKRLHPAIRDTRGSPLEKEYTRHLESADLVDRVFGGAK